MYVDSISLPNHNRYYNLWWRIDVTTKHNVYSEYYEIKEHNNCFVKFCCQK